MSFRHIKVGDKVTRLLSSAMLPMELVVVKVDDQLLYCDKEPSVCIDGNFWKFDRDSGVEEDPEVGLGTRFGVTGSVLKPTPPLTKLSPYKGNKNVH